MVHRIRSKFADTLTYCAGKRRGTLQSQRIMGMPKPSTELAAMLLAAKVGTDGWADLIGAATEDQLAEAHLLATGARRLELGVAWRKKIGEVH